MSWYIQLIVAIFMVMFYSFVSRELRNNSNFLYRRLLNSFGIGMFSLLLMIFWTYQYSIHNTIIYWRIIELFK